MVCKTHVHAATIQTGHDMPAGIASLTNSPIATAMRAIAYHKSASSVHAA